MKEIFSVIVGLFLLISVYAQRQTERLNHGLIAVNTNEGNYVSWRVLANEMEDVAYNIYRNGQKLNDEPISNTSNLVDTLGGSNANYSLTKVINGVEIELNESASVFSQNYHDVPLQTINGGYNTYEANDASLGDLDGDGEYEIIIKRVANDMSEASTDYHLLQAYKLNGTMLWSINIGPNIYNKVEFNFLVWDFDGDGKAEIATRTSEGTIDGLGNQIGDIDGDGKTNYRDAISMEYRYEGPDFLSIFDGETGKELVRTNYIPREPIIQWGLPGQNIGQTAHRSTKCMFTIAYLNGKTPSIVISRGIYEKIALEAWNFKDNKLEKVWHFDTDQPGNADYAKSGYHNLTQGDVDNDGRDEIMYGSMCVDDDGTGLYTTKLGHGDAQHLTDINPDRPGLEYFGCNENATGGNYRDAGTGEILYYKSIGRDMGRAGCSDVTPNYPGMEMWGASGFPFLSSTGQPITDLTPPSSMNFFIWWDGDPIREMLDHEWHDSYGIGTIVKYNNGANTRLLTAKGTLSNNWTKGTPCLSADIYGDWREEVIWRTENNDALRIYTTTIPTDRKIYTLMQDPQYRAAIAWQQNSYNQPPHPSFFIGHNMDSIPPSPLLFDAQKVWQSGIWENKGSTSFNSAFAPSSFQTGDSVLFDTSGESKIELIGELEPGDIRVISPSNFYWNGTGSIVGKTKLTKSGIGKLTINNTHKYSGITRVWEGELCLNGTIENSKVYVKRFATLSGSGKFNNGIVLEKYANLNIGSSPETGDTLFVKGQLIASNSTYIRFDLTQNALPTNIANDYITIEGDFNFAENIKFEISTIDGKLGAGNYKLVKCSGKIVGNINNIEVVGIPGVPYQLQIENNEVLLSVSSTREAGKVTWQGSINKTWDVFNNKNWLFNGKADYFIGGDFVNFTDDAIETEIDIIENYAVSGIDINSSKDFILSGNGSISGNTSLIKSGSGSFTIKTNNSYTGGTVISDGILSIPALTNGEKPCALGIENDNTNILINGGTLAITGGASSSNRKITIGENNGTISVDNNLSVETAISGNGLLIKDGLGTLSLLTKNKHKGTVIKAGTIYLGSEEANIDGLGNTVIFEGGKLTMENSTASYTDNCKWNIIVEEGMTGTINLDGRSSLTGSLSGGGNLTINTPFIRSELNGNWSAFSGRIGVITSTSGATFLVGNNEGLKNSSLELGDNVTMIYAKTSNVTFEIGELTGTKGSIIGSGGQGTNNITWKIGGLNTDAVFNGLINNTQMKGSGSTTHIIKVGTGNWTLKNSNTYTGNTTIEAGTLVVENNSGSATGTGTVTCLNNAILSGTGTIDGEVLIQNGGTLQPAGSKVGSIKLSSNLSFSENAEIKIDLYAGLDKCDNVEVGEKINLNGTLTLRNLTITPYSAGNAFKIFDCKNIQGKFINILPETPGDGLKWDLSELNTNGTIKVIDKVGISVINNNNQVHVYPIPFNNEIYLELDYTNEKQSIKIYNLQGKQMHVITQRITATTWHINADNLISGSYFITLEENNKIRYSSTLIKQ